MLAGLAAGTLMNAETATAKPANTFLEIKTWRLHNSAEDQGARVAAFLDQGLGPALSRSGAQLAGAFANVIAPDGPYYVTITQFASLAAMQDVLEKLERDRAYQIALNRLSTGSGLPFVRVESSLLRSFDVLPELAVPPRLEGGAARIFELRTYESQSFTTLQRKVRMFNEAEAKIFERLAMRPVFFGETIVGPKQPNLMYMLSFDDLAARDRLWREFGSDPEWAKLSARPELKDPEIVANISNVILRPLAFSAVR